MENKNHQEVEQLLHRLFPNERTEVKFVVHSGIDAVSGAKIAHFHLHRGRAIIQAMIKRAPDVGTNERAGGKLISPYLRIPSELRPHGNDYYLYQRVRGMTVDRYIREKHTHSEVGREHFLTATREHLKMWRQTLSKGIEPVGYVSKVDKTLDNVKATTLWHNSLEEISNRRLVVNGLVLPSFNELCEELRSVIATPQPVVLSHGDEGSCNHVVCRETEELYYIDHGTAGRRIISEPIVKVLLWFPATLSEHLKFDFRVLSDSVVIDYQINLDPIVGEMVAEAKEIIFDELGQHIDKRSLYACAAMYFLREVKWIERRHRELMTAPLLAMAMEAAGVVAGALPGMPLLTPHRQKEPAQS